MKKTNLFITLIAFIALFSLASAQNYSLKWVNTVNYPSVFDVSNNLKYVASVGFNTKIKVVDYSTNTMIFLIKDTINYISQLKFTPSGDSLLIICTDTNYPYNPVYLFYDMNKKEIVKRTELPSIKYFRFSGNMKYVAGYDSMNRFFCWETKSGELIIDPEQDYNYWAYNFGFCEKDDYILLNQDGFVLKINLLTHQIENKFEKSQEFNGEISVIPDGSCFTINSYKCNLGIFDSETGEYKRYIQTKTSNSAPVYDLDGKKIYYRGVQNNDILVWDFFTGKLIKHVIMNDYINIFTNFNDGFLVTGSNITIYERDLNTVIKEFPLGSNYGEISLDTKQNSIFSTFPGFILDINNGNKIRDIKNNNLSNIYQTDSYYYVLDSILYIYDANKDMITDSFRLPYVNNWDKYFSPQMKYLALYETWLKPHFYDWQTKKELYSLDSIPVIKFFNDPQYFLGARLLDSSAIYEIRKTRTGELVYSNPDLPVGYPVFEHKTNNYYILPYNVNLYKDKILKFNFGTKSLTDTIPLSISYNQINILSDDDRYFIFADSNNLINIFDLESKSVIASINYYWGKITKLLFSDKNKYLVVLDDAGILSCYDVSKIFTGIENQTYKITNTYKIAPNPVRSGGKVSISFNNIHELSNVQLSISNILGENINNISYSLLPGRIILFTEGMTSGMYYITIKIGNNFQTLPLAVID